jgi:opacity protein-like surface antigen
MTKQRIKLLCLAASLTLAPQLLAQTTAAPDFFFKMRGEAGATATSGYRNSYGFGAGANLDMGGGNSLGLELSYNFNPGTIYRCDLPANTLGITQDNSVLTQKHSAEMLGARASYSMPIDESWSWHAGLGLYHSKATMETVGDFEGGIVTSGPDGAWTTTAQKSSLMIEPFVGLDLKLTESGSVAFELAYQSFKTPDVAPSYGAATLPDYQRVTPVWGTKTVSTPKLVITYVFHF